MPHVGMPQQWSQASHPGANDMSQPGVSRDTTERGSVNALKRRRSLEVSTAN